MLSPELYSRTRSTLPELIAHPSQFARELAATPLPSAHNKRRPKAQRFLMEPRKQAQTLAASGLRDFRVPFVPDTLSAPNDDPP